MDQINVLIADDHKIFRDGIKSLLSKEKGIHVTAEASNGKEAIDMAKEHKIDLVIMDIDMGSPNGIETTASLKKISPGINILILSMLGLHDFIIQALEAGATGYILKNAGKDELLTAIKSVAHGDSYFSREVSSSLIEQLHWPKFGKKKLADIPLSPREVEVLKYIAQEFSNQEIAEKMFISIRTVDTHRRNLIEKLGVRNNVGLTKYAISKGLID
jgi:DNA-binding NarL/FixJ family response regulator